MLSPDIPHLFKFLIKQVILEQKKNNMNKTQNEVQCLTTSDASFSLVLSTVDESIVVYM